MNQNGVHKNGVLEEGDADGALLKYFLEVFY